MAAVACPHCTVPNEQGSTFCQSCGKALPAVAATGPRVIAGQAVAATSAGMKLQVDELHKQLKKAAGALLWVAILQTLFGALIYFLVHNATAARAPAAVDATSVVIFGIAAVFWALYFWARVNPLPAAIVGLVIYVTLWALDFIVALAAMGNAPAGQAGALAANPFRGIVIKIIIIAILVRAIKAGQQHRKLLRQQQAGFEPLPVA
ncbi:MAG TPA: zinc ribbon domain-containing protein [Tepidisphaeraceae bacterium]|jgi:hypothetical protein